MCCHCRQNVTSCNKIPTFSTTNGFSYPPHPELPSLDIITERLISPRLIFMQLRRLRYQGYAIIGQVINVPVNVETMVTSLPRDLGEDHAINVNIKKNLLHKSTYLSGVVKKRVVRAWLNFLQNQPLYKHYNIKIDWNRIRNESVLLINNETTEQSSSPSANDIIEERLNDDNPDCDIICANQQTLMWNEEFVLNIAPGQKSIPLNIIYDVHAEELAFPSIYYGVHDGQK